MDLLGDDDEPERRCRVFLAQKGADAIFINADNPKDGLMAVAES